MLYLSGYHASGKSHIARRLVGERGYHHIETSAIVRAAHAPMAHEISLPDWAKLMEDTHGPDYFDKMIVDATIASLSTHDSPERTVITGNRSFEGIVFSQRALHRELGERAGRFLTIFISTSPEVMYDRYVARNRYEGDATISFEEYVAIMKEEEERGIKDIHVNADVIINNDTAADDTYCELARILDQHFL